jgi:hypothetical protein
MGSLAVLMGWLPDGFEYPERVDAGDHELRRRPR